MMLPSSTSNFEFGWKRASIRIGLNAFKGIILFIIALSASPASALDNDAALKTFKKCKSCHAIGEEATNKVGPHLNGLEGRTLAGIEEYSYSKAMKAALEEGKLWDKESLDAFLKKPKGFLKGTKMNFVGIKEDEERENLVLWLFHFDAEGKEISEAAELKDSDQIVLLGASATAIEGDSEYGEYLSGECVTCHKLDGTDEGIPTIIGWPKEQFIDALYQYKSEIRDNPVMRTVAKRLGDEEMAALAAYYSSLPQE